MSSTASDICTDTYITKEGNDDLNFSALETTQNVEISSKTKKRIRRYNKKKKKYTSLKVSTGIFGSTRINCNNSTDYNKYSTQCSDIKTKKTTKKNKILKKLYVKSKKIVLESLASIKDNGYDEKVIKRFNCHFKLFLESINYCNSSSSSSRTTYNNDNIIKTISNNTKNKFAEAFIHSLFKKTELTANDKLLYKQAAGSDHIKKLIDFINKMPGCNN